MYVRWTQALWGAPAQAFSTSVVSPAISMWRNLGFTVVPTVGVGYATPPENPGTLLSPANRTDWAAAGMTAAASARFGVRAGARVRSLPGGSAGSPPGSSTPGTILKYGIMIEPFSTAGLSAPPHGLGCFDALTRRSPAAADSPDPSSAGGFNFTAVGLTAAQEAVERAKWRAALEFYSAQGMIDLSYDGFFLRQNLATIGKLVAFAQPGPLDFSLDADSASGTFSSHHIHVSPSIVMIVPVQTCSTSILRCSLSSAPG